MGKKQADKQLGRVRLSFSLSSEMQSSTPSMAKVVPTRAIMLCLSKYAKIQNKERTGMNRGHFFFGYFLCLASPR